ncbi:hypothetical protein RRG08_021392 [Elysia crispata]|uniref:Uncharacterized protein n=1 Tax=Elysia crispata TaxID=231223 RepID=A0AAE0Z6U2_9GAST|nr:hypothetical protein RRG08_021392 [Elysia crispata]
MQFDKTEEEEEQYSRGESEYKMKHSSGGSAIVNNKQTTTKTTPKQYANVGAEKKNKLAARSRNLICITLTSINSYGNDISESDFGKPVAYL